MPWNSVFVWNLTLRFFCTKYAVLIKFAACVFIIVVDFHDENLPALPCDVYIGGSQLAPVGHGAQLLPEAEGGL